MTGGALPILNRLVFDLGFGELLRDIVMALEAEFAIGLCEQLLVIGLVCVMAGDALAILDGLVFDFGLGELLRDIVMALEAEFAAGFEQQLLIVGGVRGMAGSALAILNRLMLDFGLGQPLVDFLMAFSAEFAARLEEQVFVIRLVRIVAGNALAILSGLMLHLGLSEQLSDIVMAVGAEAGAGPGEEVRVVGLVGRMAGGALAVFEWLMFQLGFGREVLVAGEANLARFARHLLGELGFVAKGAFPFGVGRMDELLDADGFGGAGRWGVGRGRLSERGTGGCVSARADRWDAIKESRQPLVLSLTAAACQDQQAQGGAGDRDSSPRPGRFPAWRCEREGGWWRWQHLGWAGLGFAEKAVDAHLIVAKLAGDED